MIAIRVVLVGALVALLLWFLRSRNAASVRALKKVLLMVLVSFAIAAVLNPEMTDDVAAWFGVGRGADLLLYFVTVSFLFFAMNSYLKHLDLQQQIVVISREVALLKHRVDNCLDA